jgi:hypothetical protein
MASSWNNKEFQSSVDGSRNGVYLRRMSFWKKKGNGEAAAMFKRAAGSPEPAEKDNFTTLLLLSIELLKHGAPAVDIHLWGLRVRVVEDSWSVGPIPAKAAMDHLRMLRESLEQVKQPPTIGDGGPSDEADTPEARITSENP